MCEIRFWYAEKKIHAYNTKRNASVQSQRTHFL
jgi:hypothetical protein